MTNFSYEGTKYAVPIEVMDWYSSGRRTVCLPDGRLLKVTGWLESLPPQPVLEAASEGDILVATVVR